MPHWFLSTRAHSVGGPVGGSVDVIDADRPGFPTDLTPELVQAIRGRDILFAVHGFNVNQKDGIAHLGFWMDTLDIGNAIPIGILWPGDCFIPIFLDYVVEGHEALKSGDLLAAFLNKSFTAAASVSFASHSLGARVVLQTIQGLNPALTVRRTVLMAGAIDDTCLTAEYQTAAGRIKELSLLASQKDDVLSMAYPLGNPLQGIIDTGHPYRKAALGREGPEPANPSAPGLEPDWMIPDDLDYGHLDYIPGKAIAAKYPQPVNIPPATNPPAPPPGTPPVLLQPPEKWKPAFSAGFVSTRYQRP
jgi:Alpha/beta hydrolase of unknown function (DUF900)